VGAIALTYPSAASLVAALPGVAIGDTFECLFETTSTGGITFTAGVGVTFRRNSAVVSPNSSLHWIRFTNVTSGSEAVVVYAAAVS
jgi:hypothetical protein